MTTNLRPACLALSLGLFTLALTLAGGPAAAEAGADADQAAALQLVRTALAEPCSGAFDEAGAPVTPPQRFDVVSPSLVGGSPSPMVIWQIECGRGAYNVSHVFVKKTEFGGMNLLSFAFPDLDVVLTDPEDFESAVQEVRITGWSSRPDVVNADFDPATLQLSEYSAWRGIGDASSYALWTLRNESFSLLTYGVDASYDGEVNPEVLVDLQ